MNGPIFAALADVLQIHNIMASMAGVIFGLFIGSTPGLTISLGMVLLLPITFKLSAVTAVCLLLGLYAAGMTGGSLSAILSKDYTLNDVFQHYIRYCVPELKIKKENVDFFIDFILQSKDIVHNAYTPIELLRISKDPNYVIKHYKTLKQVEALWKKYNKLGFNFAQIKAIGLKIDWEKADPKVIAQKSISKLKGLRKIVSFWTKEYQLDDKYDSLPF